MRSFLLFIFVCLQTMAYSQLIFEEVTPPEDFNISTLRKSPSGEYFVQTVNDMDNLYSSLNGQDWTKVPLPASRTMYEIQFFSDGTPVLKWDYDEHLIRRNGSWYTMKLSGASGNIETSFIKADTLFVFQGNTFAYSIDKGISFHQLFTISPGVAAHSANLWKINSRFVLHHTLGATDYLTVFSENGDRVFDRELAFGSYDFTYNDCGQVLMTNYDVYYLFKEEDLSLAQGATESIIPNYPYSEELFSYNSQYYIRTGSTIFKTTGCNFTWQPLVTGDLIKDSDDMWLDANGDIFLWDQGSDHFTVHVNGSGTWVEQYPNINHAFVYSVNESEKNDQVSLTSNAFFHKKGSDAGWAETNTIGGYNYEVQYSPDGDLYINRMSDIQYSTDNGATFTAIELPEDELLYTLNLFKVLDNDILFILDEFSGQCYYSLNNGHNWVKTAISSLYEYPKVKLVNNYIIIADLNYQYAVSRINLATGQVESEILGDFYALDYSGSAILDDGTIYFQATGYNGNLHEGLFRYRFGEGLEFIGQFDQLIYINAFAASGLDLFAFSSGEYYVLNGSSLETFEYTGLPGDRLETYFVASNQHVYSILDNHRIFRSTKPLSSPNHITGTVYYDDNEDCTIDTLDTVLKFWQVKVETDNYMRTATTDSKGRFSFTVPSGDYTLSSKPVSKNWDLCAFSYPITVNEDDLNASQHFLAQALTECADVELDFSTPLLRRCFENYYSIRVRNTGPGATEGTTLTIQLDPFFDFTSATYPYTLVGDSILKFDLGVLEVGEEINFRIYFNLSCDADLGMEHCLTGILSDDNICGDTRSVYTECQENIGSFDPNDKRIFNSDGFETETIDKGEYIYYHIRFQNTGTDTAFKVRILDPLSPKLDLSTLEMLSASQAYTYTLTDGPALEITFDNILLPDSSTNEAASHGYIKFRIKPLPQYDYGTTIPNQAGIIFDFNAPVITNNAILVIQAPVGTREPADLIDFNVFPSPAITSITVSVSDQDINRIDAFEVMDQLGHIVMQTTVLDKNTLDVGHLAPGVYHLAVKEKERVIGVRKFVKM